MIGRLSSMLARLLPGLFLAGGLAAAPPPAVFPVQEQFVDCGGVLVYVKTVGTGEPLILLHGGPGATHEYLLPHLLPLARHYRLIFLDERGSGRSQKLEDPSGYTEEAMADDVEAVRQALGLGKVAVLGHSCGGVLAQTYALKYPASLSHLILCSTFHSTRAMNEVLRKMKEKMAPELRASIDRMEAAGLFGKGRPYERGRYTPEYAEAAWGQGYFPYLYGARPDPRFEPAGAGPDDWAVYREMWGSHGEFIIDGNLRSVEYADRLPGLKVPTLITAGDHDECDPSLAREMNRLIPGSRLVLLPDSGHMTFVDQPKLFLEAVESFLHPAKKP
jgi:proline iminopeptidase